MPDLGKYAFAVLGSYTVTIVALVALVLVTWLRARGVARRLQRMEGEGREHG